MLSFTRDGTRPLWNIQTAQMSIGYGMYPFTLQLHLGEGQSHHKNYVGAWRRRPGNRCCRLPWRMYLGLVDDETPIEFVAWCDMDDRVYFQAKASGYWVHQTLYGRGNHLVSLTKANSPNTAFHLYQI